LVVAGVYSHATIEALPGGKPMTNYDKIIAEI